MAAQGPGPQCLVGGRNIEADGNHGATGKEKMSFYSSVGCSTADETASVGKCAKFDLSRPSSTTIPD